MKGHPLYLLLLLFLFSNHYLFSQGWYDVRFNIVDHWEYLDENGKELIKLNEDSTYSIEMYTRRTSGTFLLSSIETGCFQQIQSGILVFNVEKIVIDKDTIQNTDKNSAEFEIYRMYKFPDRVYLSFTQVTKYKKILGNRNEVVGSTFASITGDTISFRDNSEWDAFRMNNFHWHITDDALYIGKKNKLYKHHYE